MADPTLQTVAAFRDPSKWAKIEQNVPVFVTHRITIKDKDGKPRLLEVDASRLQRIADRINRNWRENGVPVKFLEGHSLFDETGKPLPQAKQPPILSYGIDAQVGRWGPRGKLGILMKQFVLPGCLGKVRQLPFRSAEYYDDTDDLTGVALLRTDPELDMGCVFYGKADGCRLYARPMHYGSGRTPLYLYWSSNMADMPTPPNAAPAPPTEPPDAGAQELDPGFENQAHQYMRKHFPHMHAMHEQYAKSCAPIRYEEGMAPADATNPMPGTAAPDQQAAADQYGRRNGTPNHVLAERVLNLERQLQYGRKLLKLKDAGCDFDYEVELTDSLDMPEAAFERHLTRLQRSGRGPIGIQRVITGDPTAPNLNGHRQSDAPTPQHVEMALQYMRQHQLSGEAGWAKAMADTKGK